MAAWNQRISRLSIDLGDLPPIPAYSLTPGLPTPGPPILLRLSIEKHESTRNFHSFPISYAFQPCLRGRLTLGRLPLPRKPWVYGEQVSCLFYRYSCQHNHFPAVHKTFQSSFIQQGTLPYHPSCNRSAASVVCLAPLHFRRNVIRPVSYYAFFKRWLLLSQRPGCLYNVTTLTTEHTFGDLSRRSGLFPSRRRTLAPAV